MSTADRTYRTAEDVLFRELTDGESVLLDLKTENYFGLNATGTRVWSCLANGQSIADAVASISDATGMDRTTVLDDVGELVALLASKGLVVEL